MAQVHSIARPAGAGRQRIRPLVKQPAITHHDGVGCPLLFRGKLVISSNQRIDLVPIHEILMCEACNNYAIVHTLDGKQYMISKPLKWVEHNIGEGNFFRVHQSYMIHLDQIIAIDRTANCVLMAGSVKVPISRSRRTDFYALIGQ